MSYDQRCYDLARVFLEAEQIAPELLDRACDRLAQIIQTSIEDNIGYVREHVGREQVEGKR